MGWEGAGGGTGAGRAVRGWRPWGSSTRGWSGSLGHCWSPSNPSLGPACSLCASPSPQDGAGSGRRPILMSLRSQQWVWLKAGRGQAQSHEALTPQVMPWVFSRCGVWVTSDQAGHGHQGDARSLWWPPWAGATLGLRPQHRPPAHRLPPGLASPTGLLHVSTDSSLWPLLRKPRPTSGETQGGGGSARGPGVRGLP